MSLCAAVCAVALLASPANSGGERVVTTELAGVPAILRIPARASKQPIVLWHGFGPPASEQALMQALPLDDVPAVKVYLGLPLFGKRAPTGGTDELVRRQNEDIGLRVFEPVVVGAANELTEVTRELARQGFMKTGDRIGAFGFSAGGAATLLSLAEHNAPIRAAILLNPSTGLTASVQAFEQATHQAYLWTPRSRALAGRTDAERRAAEIAKGTPLPALLILEGEQDDIIAHQSLRNLEEALAPYYTEAHERERLEHRTVKGLPHNITGSHSDEELGRRAAAWFNRYL